MASTKGFLAFLLVVATHSWAGNGSIYVDKMEGSFHLSIKQKLREEGARVTENKQEAAIILSGSVRLDAEQEVIFRTTGVPGGALRRRCQTHGRIVLKDRENKELVLVDFDNRFASFCCCTQSDFSRHIARTMLHHLKLKDKEGYISVLTEERRAWFLNKELKEARKGKR